MSFEFNVKELGETLKEEINRIYGDAYEVDVRHVKKNNGTELQGLAIRKDGQAKNIAPVLYVENYIGLLEDGISLSAVAKSIIDAFENDCDSKMKKIEVNTLLDWEFVSERLFIRIVSYDRNKEWLETIPYYRFMNLAVTFAVLVNDNVGSSIASTTVTNDLVKIWEKNKVDIMCNALFNSCKLFPPVFERLEDIIGDIIDGTDDIDSHNLLLPGNDDWTCNQCDLYVLTNNRKVHGASVIMYLDILRTIAEKLESDLVILPSSVHEVIVMKKDDSVDKDRLVQMVHDINLSEVAPEDILEDTPYIYERELDKLSILE